MFTSVSSFCSSILVLTTTLKEHSELHVNTSGFYLQRAYTYMYYGYEGRMEVPCLYKLLHVPIRYTILNSEVIVTAYLGYSVGMISRL